MDTSINNIKKRGRGRPTKDTLPIMVRVSRDEARSIDAFIAQEGAPFITRPEAIRRLIKKALEVERHEQI